jgi:hypothetical protein
MENACGIFSPYGKNNPIDFFSCGIFVGLLIGVKTHQNPMGFYVLKAYDLYVSYFSKMA